MCRMEIVIIMAAHPKEKDDENNASRITHEQYTFMLHNPSHMQPEMQEEPENGIVRFPVVRPEYPLSEELMG